MAGAERDMFESEFKENLPMENCEKVTDSANDENNIISNLQLQIDKIADDYEQGANIDELKTFLNEIMGKEAMGMHRSRNNTALKPPCIWD